MVLFLLKEGRNRTAFSSQMCITRRIMLEAGVKPRRVPPPKFTVKIVNLYGEIMLEKHGDAPCGASSLGGGMQSYAHLGRCVFHSLLTNGSSIWSLLGAFTFFTLQCTHGEHSEGPGSFFLVVSYCVGELLSKRYLFENKVEHLRTLLFLGNKAKKLTQTWENFWLCPISVKAAKMDPGSDKVGFLHPGPPSKTSLEALSTILDTSSCMFCVRRECLF